MHEQYSDPLSRRTWSLALIAAADAETVISNLARIDTCLSGLSDDDFLATAASSSRIGVMEKNRRLPERIWSSSAGLSPRTRLLLAHFTASLSVHEPLLPLQDSELEALVGPGAEAWPIARAVTSRLLTQPSPALLQALAALGPTTVVELPPTGEKSYAQASGADRSLDPGLRSAILDEPGL